MSVITYNGVYIQLLKTASLEAYCERDKLSGVDVLWYKYTVRAKGVVCTGVGFPTNSRADWLTVRDMLQSPRRSFSYTVGGTPLLNWAPAAAGPTPDAAWGPEPLPATVREINEGVFFVDVGYILRLADCDGSPTKNAVVSLRWTQSESFDQNWNSRVTTRGTLVTRADLASYADNFRAMCVPPVLPDYQRLSADYTLSASGSELDFAFVDQETDRLPPAVATKASGRFTVTIMRGGVQRIGQVDITLEGPKASDRTNLLVKALSMAYVKLAWEGVQGAGALPVYWGTFVEDLWEPKVHVTVQAVLNPVGEGPQVKNRPDKPAVMTSVGFYPDTGVEGGGDGRPGIAGPVRKRLLGLVAAAFRDPCALHATRPSPGGGGTTANTSVVAPPAGSATYPYPQPTLNVGQTGGAFGGPGNLDLKDAAPYDRYEIQSQYRYDSGKRMMPGTGVGPTPNAASVVQVGGESMTLEVSWVAMRTGQPPVLPAFVSNDPNVVPLRSSLVPAQPDRSADGALAAMTVAGHYVYGILDPARASVLAPIPPFFGTASSQYALQAAGYTSDQILWQFQGASGPNPFVGRTTSSQPALALPPAPAQGGGGTQQVPVGGLGSAAAGGGGVLPRPQVNA